MKITKLTLFVIAVVLVAAFVLAAKWYGSQQPAPGASTPLSPAATGAMLVRPHSPTLGPNTAPVTIVEFFDPECESCRAMYPIVKQVLADFDGKVKLVIRYQPLHPNSMQAASLLEAAREQNKYWEYLEIMMMRQPEWASHNAPRPELLVTYAPHVGLDAAKLQQDAAALHIRARIQQDQADGTAYGATRTPTFFINGKVLPRLGYQELRAAVQAELR